MKLAALEWLELQSSTSLSDTPIIFDQIISPIITEAVQSITPVRTTRQVERTIGPTATQRALDAIDNLPTIPLPFRKLTPAGRVYEVAKGLSKILIVTDPLGIID